jgi:hypothetical protein
MWTVGLSVPLVRFLGKLTAQSLGLLRLGLQIDRCRTCHVSKGRLFVR